MNWGIFGAAIMAIVGVLVMFAAIQDMNHDQWGDHILLNIFLLLISTVLIAGGLGLAV